jgi:hypothetical protein
MIAAEYEAVQLYMQVMKFLKILQTRSDFMPESFFDC